MRDLARSLAIAATLLVAACASNPDQQLAAFPGLVGQLESFYRGRAFERGATCVSPGVTVTDARIVQETPQQLLVQARYVYQGRGSGGGGNGSGSCTGFGERLFTVAREGAATTVVAMSGEQR
jgi:hypothetical protein